MGAHDRAGAGVEKRPREAAQTAQRQIQPAAAAGIEKHQRPGGGEITPRAPQIRGFERVVVEDEIPEIRILPLGPAVPPEVPAREAVRAEAVEERVEPGRDVLHLARALLLQVVDVLAFDRRFRKHRLSRDDETDPAQGQRQSPLEVPHPAAEGKSLSQEDPASRAFEPQDLPGDPGLVGDHQQGGRGLLGSALGIMVRQQASVERRGQKLLGQSGAEALDTPCRPAADFLVGLCSDRNRLDFLEQILELIEGLALERLDETQLGGAFLQLEIE